ncbi:hypothetical protein TNCV_1688471 [Trichonephila clavipes]|nr:hypothetical protein TNCV_1688471 [Trichonephila clavipes]
MFEIQKNMFWSNLLCNWDIRLKCTKYIIAASVLVAGTIVDDKYPSIPKRGQTKYVAKMAHLARAMLLQTVLFCGKRTAKNLQIATVTVSQV